MIKENFVKYKFIYSLIIILLISISISGCKTTSASNYHIREDVDFSYIKKVAVMPLENMTNDKFAPEIIRQAVITELLATGAVDVVVPGDVMFAIDRLGIKNISLPSVEQIKNLGKMLQAQAIILGSVERFGDERIGNVSAPTVSITLMMADTTSGSIIWSASRTRGGASFVARHFGARTDTLSETAIKVVREAIQTLIGTTR